MKKLVLVCGPVGAGKTTYSLTLSKELQAVRFSIDPWMRTLFANDMKSLDFEWITERVDRCCKQIWETTEQILSLNGNVVLDLGFTTRKQRLKFSEKAKKIGVIAELHYLSAEKNVRWKRIEKRNKDQDPDVYSFELTEAMFKFMEPRFEAPSKEEIKNGYSVNS